MQNYKIKLEKAAVKYLERQDKKIRLKLYKLIYQLPAGTDIKKLKSTNLYRLRSGKLRIIYSVDEQERVITIVNIDSRGQVYSNI